MTHSCIRFQRRRPRRSLVAIATAIRDGVARVTERNFECPRLSVDDLARLLELTRRIEGAKRQGWKRAAACLTRKQPTLVRYVHQQLHVWLEQRGFPRGAVDLPSGTGLLRDLVALESEFGAVGCDFKKIELFVTTEPITLEEVDLGRFEIRLNWMKLFEEGTPFRVVALHPNPAADSDLVTHPHVRGEGLCVGNGRRAVDRALARWELFDFFIIVNQILLTYSPERAFFKLSDWQDGRSCADCGSSIDEETVYYCQGCSTAICEDCVTFCGGCNENFCSQCAKTCDRCDSYLCSACLSTCAQCQAAVCRGCRHHDTLCKQCHEHNESNDHPDSERVAQHPQQRRRPLPAGAAI